jgi:uncharacterized membrane protein (UPF0127 family)
VNWRSQIVTFLVIFLVVGLLFAMPGGCRPSRQQAGARPAAARVVDLSIEGMPPAATAGRLSPYSFIVHAEVAETKEQRQRGLSGRPGLEPGYGILYVYEHPERPEFSEASTSFSLSVAFMRADGTVLGIHDTEPNDPTPFTPPEPVTYALEVRRGWFQDRDIGVGARFKIPPEVKGSVAPPTEAPPTVPAETPVK